MTSLPRASITRASFETVGAARDFLLQRAVLVRRGHRDDARTLDKNVAHRGIVDVAIMIIDTAAANEQRGLEFRSRQF